ncbi:AMP-binding protein, partial [Rhizobium ruizarguesonis]
LRKARITLALCDHRLTGELESAATQAPDLERIVAFGGPDAELEALMAQPGYEAFEAADTARDDVCLIAFTSGTTGEPKG